MQNKMDVTRTYKLDPSAGHAVTNLIHAKQSANQQRQFSYDENGNNEIYNNNLPAYTSSSVQNIYHLQNSSFGHSNRGWDDVVNERNTHQSRGSVSVYYNHSLLSPVKEESDKELSQRLGRSHKDAGLKSTLQGFTDVALHHDSFSRCHTSMGRFKAHKKTSSCNLSSDSGLGRLHGSCDSSECITTSDSSYASSSSSHTDDVDHSEIDEVGQHDGQPSVQGTGRDTIDGEHTDNRGTDMEGPAPDERDTRPRLSPLVFRARRKVAFSDNDPSSDTTDNCFSSPFSTSGRPLLTRQESEESTSSTSSRDSVLAVPLSPLSPCEDSAQSPFHFTVSGPEQQDFSVADEGSDLVLTAEGRQFHVHSSVVAWQCLSLLQHLRHGAAPELLLHGKRADVLLTFLHLLYPYHKESITEHNVDDVLDMALTLGCERVLRMCTTFLIGLAHFRHLCPHRHLQCRRPDAGEKSEGECKKRDSQCGCAESMVDRTIKVLETALKYQLDDVYSTYLHVIARLPADDVTKCPRYSQLPSAVRQDILTSRARRLETVMDRLTVRDTDLATCGHDRHADRHVTYHGQLCVRCVTNNLLDANSSG